MFFQDLPPILRSCVRVINLYGLHHHGIFRVSGSQVEINHFRDAFERGEDPLADTTDASDINSVADEDVRRLFLGRRVYPFGRIVPSPLDSRAIEQKYKSELISSA